MSLRHDLSRAYRHARLYGPTALELVRRVKLEAHSAAARGEAHVRLRYDYGDDRAEQMIRDAGVELDDSLMRHAHHFDHPVAVQAGLYLQQVLGLTASTDAGYLIVSGWADATPTIPTPYLERTR